MSTRSLICQKTGDTYKTIYCHCHSGRSPVSQLEILEKYYSQDHINARDELLSNRLYGAKLSCMHKDGRLELRSYISSLGIDLNNFFNSPTFFNKSELLKCSDEIGAEYIYIYDDERWHVVTVNNPLLEGSN